jgi:hypothetical protein
MGNKLNKILDKMPVLKYILTAFIKSLILTAAVLVSFCTVLSLTKVYDKLQSMLDLKYNSPFVLVPLFASAAIAVLCFVIGFLLYFHKYKRSKSKTRFNRAFTSILENTKEK